MQYPINLNLLKSFEWSGRFIDCEQAYAYNEIRQQEQVAQQLKMLGSATTCMALPSGKLTVVKSARSDDNQAYLIIQSTYSIWDNTYASSRDVDRSQASDFYAIPTSTS